MPHHEKYFIIPNYVLRCEKMLMLKKQANGKKCIKSLLWESFTI
jgi:hypothetical protein